MARDYSQIESWGVEDLTNPEAITDAKVRGVPSALEDYLPYASERYKIRQKVKDDYVYQELSGEGWDSDMIKIARSLKMKLKKKADADGNFHIIDDDVNNLGLSIGTNRDRWEIKSWEVVADIFLPETSKHRFVDRITWRSLDGFAEYVSIHQWRLY